MKALLVSEYVFAVIGLAAGIVAALAVFGSAFLIAVLPKLKKIGRIEKDLNGGKPQDEE